MPHDDTDHHPRPNRLVGSRSPYLLQHAHNPVDWYPWGEEAFTRARETDRPVFLSVGYSTCHWCHVMEQESFEDPEVAAILNESFVSIKVDREERPDIDQVYMSICQMMTGHGGWPLTVILTPDRRPFFAGTYFPRSSRLGRVGLTDLLPQVATLWRERRYDVLTAATEITARAQQSAEAKRKDSTGASAKDGASLLAEGFAQLKLAYDARHGGFGSRPKFPQPHNLSFLLHYQRLTDEPHALAMVEHTLQQMRLGGIYDQLDGGFHRYSTDARWLLPHFEKMLYDQALLLAAYLGAYEATGKPQYALVAEEIIEYVLSRLTSPAGAFFSAEDADTEGEEGLFYTWRESEIRELLEPAAAELVTRIYGIARQGNFADEATGRKTGQNVLHVAAGGGWGALLDPDPELAEARRQLLAARERRTRPFLDDKILTDWNGLMIGALARAARVLRRPGHAKVAARAADFILAGAIGGDGRLLHRCRDGHWDIGGFLDDYAYLAWGLTELYWATWRVEYLQTAARLVREALTLFADPGDGAFFLTAHDAEELLTRSKPTYDGATPSGNAVMLLNLVRLARLLGQVEFEEAAARLADALSAAATGQPSAHTFFLMALAAALGPSTEVVIAGDPAASDTVALTAAAEAGPHPGLLLLRLPLGEGQRKMIADLAPWTAKLPQSGPTAVAYVCSGGACRLPVTSPEDLRKALL